MNYWNFQKQKFHFYLVHWTQLPLAEASKANRCQRKWNDFSIFMDKNFQKKLWFYSHIQTKMKRNKTAKSVEVCQRTYAAICLIQVLLLPVLLSFFFLFSFFDSRRFIDFHLFFYSIPNVVVVHSYWQNQIYTELKWMLFFLTKCNKVTFFMEIMFIVFTCIRGTLKPKREEKIQ